MEDRQEGLAVQATDRLTDTDLPCDGPSSWLPRCLLIYFAFPSGRFLQSKALALVEMDG